MPGRAVLDIYLLVWRFPLTPSARLRQGSCGVTGTDSLPIPWESQRQPGQLWGCRVAPPSVSRGATTSGCPTEVTAFVTGWLIPVLLLHGHQPSVPQFPHLGSEALWTKRA